MVVAVIGLVVNVASARLLHDSGHHHGPHHDHGHHDHDHHHRADDHGHHHDHNLRAAYLHVLADALTSVLAIGALVSGMLMGWTWADAAMGLVGAAVIGVWAWGLARDTGRVLLDGAVDPEREAAIRAAIESDADNRVADLHVWSVGPGALAAIVSVVTHAPRPPEHYKALLNGQSDLVHLTVEVHPGPGEPCLPLP
jgi:cation diffusion facilitator family transporter